MELASFLTVAGELLAVPSTADRPDELRRALGIVLDFVTAGAGGTHLVVERFASGGKPSALVYRGSPGAGAAGRPKFRIVLNGHLDVVPAPPEQFRPRRDGDRLYARGAHDMRVAALVQAQVFRELAATLPYPIALQLVTDEEVGGRNGTLHQIEQGVSAEFVVIGGDGQHGPAEYADLTTIPPYYRALREFLEDLDFPENLDPGASG